ASDSRRIVGPQQVPEPLIAQLLTLFDLERPQWLREGITFRDSFAELIASIFGNEIVLVDALLPELRRAGAPLFEQIRARHAEIQHALGKRADELKAKGYAEQVVPREGNEYTLLFRIDEQGHRQPATSNQEPEQTSTSALTRPLLQDFVFKPDIFIGGPAEVAYYQQIAPLHELLDVPMPQIALRGHALVAPHRVMRAFERYDVDPAEIFRTPDAILAEREPEGVARIKSIAQEAKLDLFAQLEQIGELALPADHSLAGSIQRSVGHLEFHFDKLVERAVKGLVRKDRERHAAVRELVATLYPDGHVQDRVVSWFAYWCRYGDALVEKLVDAIEPNAPVVSVVDV
ncbi:MAG TPA: bacillithiol biosynthesis BshC, partial [Thermoanaerobaculia bacterium]|nr:bacillithiol biosynthesis BshC [Thermoanaerobaculia bacterium]